jgi:hypothetical protein
MDSKHGTAVAAKGTQGAIPIVYSSSGTITEIAADMTVRVD